MKKTSIKPIISIGFLSIFPLLFIFIIFQYILNFVYNLTKPIIMTIGLNMIIGNYLSGVVAIFFILLLLFIIGWIVKTKLGEIIFNFFEKYILNFIPGYKGLSSILKSLKLNKAQDKKMLKKIAVVDLYATGVYLICFITEDVKDRYGVFVPTCPQPISGFTYFVKKEKVIITKNIKLEEALRAIVSCGVGSHPIIAEVVEEYNKQKK